MIGGIAPTASKEKSHYLSILLWGAPASGKTILAGTMPGKKLWMQFDPDGTASLPRSIDYEVADFSTYPPLKLANFKQGSTIERDIIKYVQEHNIGSIVFDSMTTFQNMTLQYAVRSGLANQGRFTASLEVPGITGWGIRTSMSTDAAIMLQKVAQTTGCHFCIISHEQEKNDDDGKVSEVTHSIAGGTANAIPLRISEIWRVVDNGKERRIYTRQYAHYRPMKSRMFLPAAKPEIVWKYDADKPDTWSGNQIADWYEAWKANGFDKIALPGQ
jgi:hypothetical protein